MQYRVLGQLMLSNEIMRRGETKDASGSCLQVDQGRPRLPFQICLTPVYFCPSCNYPCFVLRAHVIVLAQWDEVDSPQWAGSRDVGVGAEDCFQLAFHWKRQRLNVIGRGQSRQGSIGGSGAPPSPPTPRVIGMSDLRQTTSPRSFSRKVESWAPTFRGRGEDKRGRRR